jgi:hypothetical protein
MDFQVGDEIYEIIDKTVNTSVIYTIDEIIKDESHSNWHNGYTVEYTAIVKNKKTNQEEKMLLYYSSHIRNFYEKYAIKVQDYIS